MPGCQVADGAEDVRHGPAAGGQDGRRGQDDEPNVRRVGEVREEGREERLGLGGQEHGGRPWAARSGRSRLMLPTSRCEELHKSSLEARTKPRIGMLFAPCDGMPETYRGPE